MRRYIDHLLDLLCALFMVAIVLVTFFQVANRYGLQIPVSWTDEIARFLAVWVVMLGATRCVREDSHIQIDLLFNILGPKMRWVLSILINVLFITLVGIMIWHGIKILPLVSKQTAAASRISMAWVYTAIPLTSAIMLFYLGERLIGILRSERGNGDPHHEERPSV